MQTLIFLSLFISAITANEPKVNPVSEDFLLAKGWTIVFVQQFTAQGDHQCPRAARNSGSSHTSENSGVSRK